MQYPFRSLPIVLAACAGLCAAPALAAPQTPAKLAYLVSQSSPLLSKADKTAISQDFNGAPLSGKPAIHKVTADDVGCRARARGKPMTECTITYAAGKTVSLKGAKAQALFDAMDAAGIEGSAGMGHIETSVSNLRCTVDDAKAQNTPATGDNVAGFACTFGAT